MLWVGAAVGAEQAVRTMGQWREAGLAVALTVLVIPAWQVTQNFTANDRSRDTETSVHFDALFDQLPSRAAMVREDFLVDRMVTFKLIGERSAEGRQIELVPRRPDFLLARLEEGFGVYAFRNSVANLRRDGMDFSFSPVPLLNGSLDEFLSRLEDGSIVAVAVPASYAQRFVAAGGASFGAIGGPADFGQDTESNVVVLGVRGARRGAGVQVSRSDAHLGVSAGRRVGGTRAVSPFTIEILAGANDAAIRQDSRDIAWTSDGVALAVWQPDGRPAQALILEAESNFRVPIPRGPLSVYPLRGLWSRHDIGPDQWSDIREALGTGSVMVRLPAQTTVVLYFSDEALLAPRVISQSSDAVGIDAVSFAHGDRASLRANLESDGVLRGAFDGEENVYRVEVGTSEGAHASVHLAVGGIPRLAMGRLRESSGAADTAAVFRIDTDGLLRTPDRRSEVLLMSRDEQAQLVGAGWSPVDGDATGAYRWMTAAEARLVLPIAKDRTSRIRIQALLEGDSDPRRARGPTMIRLRVNGTELPSQPLRPGWHAYDWPLQVGVLPRGVNDVRFVVDGPSMQCDPFEAGRVAVSEVRAVHDP